MINLRLESDESVAFILDLHMDSNSPSSRIDDIQVTLIDKLEDIREKCKERNVREIFFAGDIFNRIACTHASVNLLGEAFLRFKEDGVGLYTILGNHDIVRNSLEAMEKSPIQTLFSFGVLEHINSNNPVIINSKIYINPFDYTEKVEPVSDDCWPMFKVLLGHVFFNASDLISDDKHNIKSDDVEKLGYDLMVLGHDHQEYPTVKIGDTTIIRCGAVLRGTAHNYNFTRKPKFLVWSGLDLPSVDNIEYVEIKHRDYRDIASEYVINKKQVGSISGLQDVLTNLAEKLADSGESDSDRILDIINTDSDLPSVCRALILKYLSEGI